jgi:aspartyl protease family protein
LVDTGASSVILSPRDAKRISIDVGSLNFTTVFSTAGGVVRAAPVILDEIRIGDFAVSLFRAFVIETPSSISVLGMDFLGRMERYEVKGRELILHW